MFEHKMRESEEGIVELKEIKPAVFQQLLKYALFCIQSALVILTTSRVVYNLLMFMHG